MARMTTDTNANLLQNVFLAKRFIEALRETLVALPLGTKEDAPRSSGKVVRWQFFGNPAAATTALAEGADPTTPRDLATTAVTATLSEYGDYFEPAKLFISTAASGTLAEIVDAAAYQAGITLDTLCYTQSLQDCSNINDSTTGLTLATIALSARELKDNNARPHPATPGGRYYALILSPEAGFDMMMEQRDFSTTSGPTWESAHGTDMGVRGMGSGIPFDGTGSAILGAWVMISQNVQAVSSEDLNYMVAKDAFGVVSIDSDIMDPRVIVTTPEQRVDKPLRNAGTVGWWVAFASELIDSNRVVEIKSDQV